MTKSEDVIITQDAARSDVFALVELLADGQKPRALNVPAGEDAPSPGEADPVPPAEQEPVDTPAPVAGEEPGEGTGGEETHTTPDTVETGREVPAGALGALAALGAGLVDHRLHLHDAMHHAGRRIVHHTDQRHPQRVHRQNV